jgi:Arm DNA-binding domain
MARLIQQLTEAKIRTLTDIGLYPDGAGLYLQIRPGGARFWIYRFRLNGRSRADSETDRPPPVLTINCAEAKGKRRRRQMRDLQKAQKPCLLVGLAIRLNPHDSSAAPRRA